MSDCILKLSKFDEGMSNILADFEPHFLGSAWQDIQRHFVHLDGCCVFLLMIVYVSHIDANSSSETVLLALDDFVVLGQGLLEHAAGFKTESVVQSHCKGQFDVNQIRSVGCLSLLAEVLFFVGDFLGLFEGIQILTS
jgi:hypothetical protein